MKLIPLWLSLCAMISAPLAAETPARSVPSALWGAHGEKWTPQSRLPDFSRAGYHQGESAIPTLPPGVSVKEFGAKGDGESDDSQAFLDAIAKAPTGAIEVPAGRYRITRILKINRSGVVLRGEGPGKTVLFCPVPLNDIQPNWSATTTGRRTAKWSWSGGIVMIHGEPMTKKLTAVTAEARRGDTAITVENPGALKPGQSIQVAQSDLADNSLAAHLYSDDPDGTSQLLGSTKSTLACRITRIDGNRVYLDRPLRCDLQLRWAPRVLAFQPSVTESGVEGLCFEFPSTPYMGHFTELGFNAVSLSDCSDCWARNLRIVNADSGFYPRGFFCTIEGVVFEANKQPDATGCTGHHGLAFYGHDNLFKNFDFRTPFLHDISVDGGASGNVAAHGKGVDLCLDHHKRTPYENLFTDLDAGKGTRLWLHGGGDALGRPCAARGTFWNIRARRPQNYPPAGFAPLSINVVALQTTAPSQTAPEGKWFEAIPPESITPQDLHEAQLARRLQGK